MRLDELSMWPADVVVAQRTTVRSEQAFDELMSSVRSNRSRLVYEIDDDLPALGVDHPEYEHYVELRSHIVRMVDAADEVWVSTAALAAKLLQLNPSIAVLQNYLDGRVWRSRAAPTRAEPLRLLYCGSPSHSGDFAQLVNPAFAELRANFGGKIELALIGVVAKDVADNGITVIRAPSDVARCYPAFVNWLRSLKPFHIGLAPLLASEFNQSKSHIKWLEYAGLGAVTVASKVGEYEASIEDGRTGILFAPDSKALAEAISSLLERPGLLESIQGNVIACAKDNIAQAAARDQRRDRLRRLLY